MALHYNLAKVYAISEEDEQFVHQILSVFTNEVPLDLLVIKEAIKNQNHEQVQAFAHKIKPSLELLGLKNAFEEATEMELWAKAKGRKKEIEVIFKSAKTQIFDAIKEIKKDFKM